LWWIPRDDGGYDGARLPIGEWLATVRAAGRSGALPEWPWLVDAVTNDAVTNDAVTNDGAPSFAGVPRLRGLRPSVGPSLGENAWLLPTSTLVLLCAFASAAWLQFRASRREAAAVRAQAEFLTTVTHELKTPLASIRLLGEMLAEGRAKGREAEYYKMLASEAGRLSVLIENVLDLGRLERGERAYDLRPVDVGEAVGETLALFAPVGERDGLRVALHDHLAAQVVARLDRGAFVQALLCVLDNARKYGAAGGSIDVAMRHEGARVMVEVRDRGSGVPEVERDRIFARFVRGSAHAHGGTPGVGIGLYLARTIARRLDGELVCCAPLDGGPGACFTFTLPMDNAA
ncbi:MAG: HAMP domain-containing sensor histidine kinase, partial [Planctomycetota bacterium]